MARKPVKDSSAKRKGLVYKGTRNLSKLDVQRPQDLGESHIRLSLNPSGGQALELISTVTQHRWVAPAILPEFGTDTDSRRVWSVQLRN